MSEPHDWTVPTSLRALLWWPPVALVVAMVVPAAAPVTIAVAGAALAVVGVLVAAVGRAVARRLADDTAEVLGAPEPALSLADASTSGAERAA